MGQRVILACYTEGYINPKQFPIQKEQTKINKVERGAKVDKRKSATATQIQIQGSQSAIGRSSKIVRTPPREAVETPEN